MQRSGGILPGGKREGAQLHRGPGDEEDQGQGGCGRGAPAGEGGGGHGLNGFYYRGLGRMSILRGQNSFSDEMLSFIS